MTRIDVALLNYEGGGLGPAGYDFTALHQAFAVLGQPPALVLMCEAKRYRDDGRTPLYAAAEVLTDQFAVPYLGLLGWSARGPIPPAIFYNPNQLILRRWCDPGDPDVFDDHRNVARFAISDSAPTARERLEILAFVAHFDYRSGVARKMEAQLLDRYGNAEPLPVIGGGDLNSTASGPHLPQRDWTAADYRSRRQKGRRIHGRGWVADTAAVDHLIGAWDERLGRRCGGCGLHAVAELAMRANPGPPLLPTVNPGVDAGGGLLIDWLLVNDAMKPHVDRASYQVHLPDPASPPPSDHRLVAATLSFGGHSATSIADPLPLARP